MLVLVAIEQDLDKRPLLPTMLSKILTFGVAIDSDPRVQATNLSAPEPTECLPCFGLVFVRLGQQIFEACGSPQ